MSELRAVVEKLTAENYAVWSARMEFYLIHHGVWKATQMDTDEGSAKARALIGLCVSDSVLPTIADCKTAKETWDKLATIFRSQSLARQLQLRRELSELKMIGGEAMTDYVARARNISASLALCGDKVQDNELVRCVLSGLPQGYDMLVTVLEATDSVTSLTLDAILPKLLVGEAKVSDRDAISLKVDTSVALASASKGPSKVKCFYCGKTGHVKKDCHKRKRDEALGKVEDRPGPSIAL